MAKSGLVIFVEPGAWRVALAPTRGGGTSSASIIDLPFAAQTPLEQRTIALSEALKAAGHSGAGAVLALQSRDCLCASIGTLDLPARQRGQAMLYRFEEKLPVSAEEIIADFIPGDTTALGVGVEKRLLEPLVTAVEAAGVRVRAVCPAAMLAAQHWQDPKPRKTDSAANMLLWPDGAGNVELFIMTPGGLPAAWYALPEEPDDIVLHIRMAMLGEHRPSRVVACGIRPEILSRISDLGIELERSDAVNVRETAADAGFLVLRGKRQPWVDFANAAGATGTGASRRAVIWAAAAMVVLMASLAAAMFVRATRYERLAADYAKEEQAVFRQALPGQAMPGDIRSRLASEARPGSRVSGQPGSTQGLMVLRDLMTYLPTDLRFRVFDLRLDDGQFTLEGEARSHGDAQGVADALGRRPGFNIDAPRTEQLPGRGVGFSISGEIAREADVVQTIKREVGR